MGAPDDITGASVYVYTYSGGLWEMQQRLVRPPEAGAFGSKLSLAGDTLLVGAAKDDTRGDDAGAAYVFTQSGTTWSVRRRLTAVDAQPKDRFGTSVATDGSAFLVGAPWDDDPEYNEGSAYIFDHGVSRIGRLLSIY